MAAILRQSTETHHQMFHIVDGEDPGLLVRRRADRAVEAARGRRRHPVRSELVYLFVRSNMLYTRRQPDEPWESFYAARILEHLQPGSA